MPMVKQHVKQLQRMTFVPHHDAQEPCALSLTAKVGHIPTVAPCKQIKKGMKQARKEENAW